MRKIASALLILTATAVSAMAQSADTWPNKPIRLIVPFPAGSSTDVVGRIVAQMLSARIGQQFVIDNRAGASGNIGMDAVARAAPDGYTIGIATLSTHALAPSLTARLPYDPLKDFAPVAMIGAAPYVMVTYPDLGPKTVQEFVGLAKTKPGKLSYGSAGPASLAHLAGALFANATGAQLLHVPYKSSAQSVTDLITGRLDMQFATIAPTLPLIRSGQLRALATTGEQRSGTLPELPTIAETGIPGYEASLWMALVMPPATPGTMVARLNKEMNAVLTGNEGKDALLAQGVDTQPGTPESLRARITTDIAKWKAVIAKAGIQAE
jgi:tripartite-type tricarboxylate transporter receptor subunit TctC